MVCSLLKQLLKSVGPWTPVFILRIEEVYIVFSFPHRTITLKVIRIPVPSHVAKQNPNFIKTM